MKLPAIIRKAAALCLLLAGNATSATVLTFTMPSGYTLDVQSTCASDPGCQLQAGPPMALSPGLIADQAHQALMPASANDISHFTSPLAAAGAEDDVFLSLIGNQPADRQADRNDGAGEVSDDLALMRKLSQGLRQTYTNIHALVALPDNYQAGARDAGAAVSGQCREGGTAGANAGCAAGAFAPVVSSLCVASDGSYNTIGAASQAACPPGSVYVGSKRGAGTAEYAAYAQSLKNFAKDAASRYSMPSFDERYTRNDAGPTQYRRCTDCDLDQNQAEPGLLTQVMQWLREPSSMLMLVLGLAAVLGADAAIRGRRG